MISSPHSLADYILRMMISCIIILVVIIFRLVQLQIQESENFIQQSNQNFLRIEKIAPLRGNIISADNMLLATNRPIINIYWQGTGAHCLHDADYVGLKQLEHILDIRLLDNDILIRNIKHAQRYYKKVSICQDINFSQLSKVVEQFPHHQNIIIDTHFQRFYPYSTHACHVLGSLSQIKSGAIGTMGLEKLFEPLLHGKVGTAIKTINSFGRNLSQIDLDKTLCGESITTTIDIKLQSIIEDVFPHSRTGACIVMNPSNGSIIATLSRPGFDPSIFLYPISTAEWHNVQKNNPFLNRAFNACYPPGSIFKLITISAAIENYIVPIDSLWYCRGYTTFCDRKYWCNKHYGHGSLTTRQALAQSCNILFFEIGRKISIDTLADYACRFGLGKPTNSLFVEQAGIVPSTEWKRHIKKQPWWTGETLSAAIGQSFLSVTPIQIACMIASIFTGYLVKPRILKNEPILTQPLNISTQTLSFLKDSMRKVVTKGTGRRINSIKDIEIFAKTSTAQTSDKNKRHLGNQFLEHSWFVAYVKYKSEEPLVLVILVEHAGDSQVPTMIAKNFLIEYKKYSDQKTAHINNMP
jgi:penicillin-binding protein 2